MPRACAVDIGLDKSCNLLLVVVIVLRSCTRVLVSKVLVVHAEDGAKRHKVKDHEEQQLHHIVEKETVRLEESVQPVVPDEPRQVAH